MKTKPAAPTPGTLLLVDTATELGKQIAARQKQIATLRAALKLCADRLEEYPDACGGIAIEGARRALWETTDPQPPYAEQPTPETPTQAKATPTQPQAARVCVMCGQQYENTRNRILNVCDKCIEDNE